MGVGLTKSDLRRQAAREFARAHFLSVALRELVDEIDRAAGSRAPARALRVLLMSRVMQKARRPWDPPSRFALRRAGGQVGGQAEHENTRERG